MKLADDGSLMAEWFSCTDSAGNISAWAAGDGLWN
jgi:hypothetical protein